MIASESSRLSLKFNLRKLLRPGILLFLIGVALLIDTSFRLGHFPNLRSSALSRDWDRDPFAVAETYAAIACIFLGAWFFRTEEDLDDSDSTDDTEFPPTDNAPKSP